MEELNIFKKKSVDLTQKSRTKLKKLVVYQKLWNMRNTWVYHHLWGKGKKQASTTLKKGCGESFKDGKGSYSSKQEVRC